MNISVVATTADDAGEIVRRIAPGAVVKQVHEDPQPVTVPALLTFWHLARAATWQKPSERVCLFRLFRLKKERENSASV